jgi:hypothetical protein
VKAESQITSLRLSPHFVSPKYAASLTPPHQSTRCLSHAATCLHITAKHPIRFHLLCPFTEGCLKLHTLPCRPTTRQTTLSYQADNSNRLVLECLAPYTLRCTPTITKPQHIQRLSRRHAVNCHCIQYHKTLFYCPIYPRTQTIWSTKLTQIPEIDRDANRPPNLQPHILNHPPGSKPSAQFLFQDASNSRQQPV